LLHFSSQFYLVNQLNPLSHKIKKVLSNHMDNTSHHFFLQGAHLTYSQPSCLHTTDGKDALALHIALLYFYLATPQNRNAMQK